jgi:hypothetical protein
LTRHYVCSVVVRWPPAEQFAVALYKGLALESRQGLASLIATALPHAGYIRPVGALEATHERRMVSEVLFHERPRRFARFN